MRALIAFCVALPLAIHASQPDLVEGHIRAVVDINAKTNGICEVHHVRMERRLAPVMFGLPGGGQEYFEAMERDFPHSLVYVAGGCVTEAKFLHASFPWFVCPECKRAERQWAEKHRDTTAGKAILSGKDPTGLDVSR
jgi:hypothetical protein